MTPLDYIGTPLDARDTTSNSSATTSNFPMVSSHTNSPFKDKIIASLGIAVELTDHKDINLGHAWQKYKACLVAIKKCDLLWESQKLRGVFD